MIKSPAEVAKAMEDDEEKELLFKYAEKAVEKRCKTHPYDTDNLNSWAFSLLGRAHHQSSDDALKTVHYALDILNVSAFRDESNNFTAWLLGKTLTRKAFLTMDTDKARLLFEAATKCFKQAVDVDPKCELFKFSLELSNKVPEIHPLVITKAKEGQRFEATDLESSNAEGMSIGDKEAKLAYEYLRKDAEEKLESDPDDVETLTTLAAHLLKLSQYESPPGSMGIVDDAILKLNCALDIDPRKPYTYWLLGKTLSARALLTHDPSNVRELFRAATQFFKEAVTLDPHKNELFAYSLRQSEKHLEPGELEQLPALGSSSSLKDVCTKEESHHRAPEIHSLLITKAMAGQRFQATDLESSNAEGMSIGDKERKLAYEYLQKAAEEKLESDPDDVETLTRLAAHLLELSQYESPPDAMCRVDDAIEKLNHALDFDPRNPYTYWLMGRTLTARVRLTLDRSDVRELFRTATQFFKAAVSMDPHNDQLFAYSSKQSEKHLKPRDLEQLPALVPSSACTKEESHDRVLKKEKVSNLKSEITGLAPIAIGIVACIGVARYLRST